MVLVASHRISPVPWYSGTPLRSVGFRLQGFHLLWRCVPGSFVFAARSHSAGPTTPTPPKRRRFGLFPVRSPLLGESLLFSLPPGTEMFQFSGLASKGLCIQPKDGHLFKMPGCPIRKSTDQGLLAAPRGLSQLITSFIACSCQGIHHAP